MKKQNPAVVYGFIGAAILILVSLGMQMFMLSSLKKSVETSEPFSPMKFLLLPIITLCVVIGVFIFCIIKSIKDYRKVNPDYTYRNLVGQGLLVTLLIALVSTAFSLLYSQVIDPGARQKGIDLTIQLLENTDSIPDDQKEQAIERVRNQNPMRQAITSLGLTLCFGLIVSLISASVLNKRGREFPGNPNKVS